jgi:hypothetical protein
VFFSVTRAAQILGQNRLMVVIAKHMVTKLVPSQSVYDEFKYQCILSANGIYVDEPVF